MKRDTEPKVVPPAKPEPSSDIQSLTDLWREYGIPLLIGGVLIVVGAVVVSLYQHNRQAAMTKAAHMLARAQTPEELQAIVTGYGSTPAAPIALLTLGAHAFADGDYERAQEIYRQFQQRYPKNLMSPVAEYGLTACLESVGQIEAAFDAYARFATAHPDHYLAAGATLARGRCLEQQGRLDEARTIYEDFIAGHPDSIWLGQAQDALLFVNRDLRAQATAAALMPSPRANPATPAPASDSAPTPEPAP